MLVWYGLGLGHDLAVRRDLGWDVPYATVRCDGRLLNTFQYGAATCVGDLEGPHSTCEYAVKNACDLLFPAGPLLTVWVPEHRVPSLYRVAHLAWWSWQARWAELQTRGPG